MSVLVLGASGATGSLVVRQLIRRNIETKILIRKSSRLAKEIKESNLVEIVKGNINELNSNEMEQLLQKCDVVFSCLGHNITFKGLFGHPRYLVRDAVRSVCEASKKSSSGKVKLVLMSTTAYTNKLSGEKNSLGEKLIFSLLTLLLPPQRDNVKAADYLLRQIGKQDKKVEWIAVRPDTLIDEDSESSYEICKSPKRSPIFNAGKTSRINVSHFMAELVTDEELWEKWLYKTPVIYNK